MQTGVPREPRPKRLRLPPTPPAGLSGSGAPRLSHSAAGRGGGGKGRTAPEARHRLLHFPRRWRRSPSRRPWDAGQSSSCRSSEVAASPPRRRRGLRRVAPGSGPLRQRPGTPSRPPCAHPAPRDPPARPPAAPRPRPCPGPSCCRSLTGPAYLAGLPRPRPLASRSPAGGGFYRRA